MDSPNCPRCGSHPDKYTAITPGTFPEQGAATICLYCGIVLVFTGNELNVRAATSEEISEFENYEGYWEMRLFTDMEKVFISPDNEE